MNTVLLLKERKSCVDIHHFVDCAGKFSCRDVLLLDVCFSFQVFLFLINPLDLYT